jgi:hypothetical protein
VSGIGSIDFSLEKLIQSILFSCTDKHWKIFNGNSASGIILDWKLFCLDSDVLRWSQQINHLKKLFSELVDLPFRCRFQRNWLW